MYRTARLFGELIELFVSQGRLLAQLAMQSHLC